MALLHRVELNGAMISFVDIELILSDELRRNLTLAAMAFTPVPFSVWDLGCLTWRSTCLDYSIQLSTFPTFPRQFTM